MAVRPLCSLIVVLVIIPSWSSAEDAAIQDFLTCSDIVQDSVRLACYDKVSDTHQQEAVEEVEAVEPIGLVESGASPMGPDYDELDMVLAPQAVEKQAAAEAPQAIAVAAASENEPSEAEPQVVPLADDVGLSALERDEPETTIRATVTDCRLDARGKYNFYFDNGQVWKQSDAARRDYEACNFEVTIKKDAFGYRMVPDGDKRKIRISRVK